MKDDATPKPFPAFLAAAAGAFGYGLKYAAYNFLTLVILICFGMLGFAYLTMLGPKIPFLNSLSFLLPIEAKGNATLGASDILRAYSVLSLVCMFLGTAAKGLIAGMKRVILRIRGAGPMETSSAMNSRTIRQYLRADLRRIIIICAVVTLIFLAAFAGIPSAKMAEGASRGALSGVIGVFYFLAMGFNFMYVLIDGISDFILDWARLHFPWPTVRDQVA